MLVVLVVIDVIPDVVQQRSVGECLPLFGMTAKFFTDRIEQSDSELLNLARVRLFEV